MLVVQALEGIQAMEPFEPFVLIGARDGSFIVLGPHQIADWLGTTIAAIGPVQRLDWGVNAARSFVRDGDIDGWALAFFREPNHWKVYREPVKTPTEPAPPGTLNLLQTDLQWKGQPTRRARLERSLAQQRLAAQASPEELDEGISWERSQARDELYDTLNECAELCLLEDLNDLAAAYEREAAEFGLSGHRVNLEGTVLSLIDENGNKHPVPPGSPFR
ncbi:hypothetical protein [Microbacterium sp. A84]|uniref:hypothetical protein n=1 Tax=Microbacterium sp. A84 TaxID=3450715 RepID=UPI003F420039